jgi:hypothetical protein
LVKRKGLHAARKTENRLLSGNAQRLGNESLPVLGRHMLHHVGGNNGVE